MVIGFFGGPLEGWKVAFIDDVRGELEEESVVIRGATGSGEPASIQVQPADEFEITPVNIFLFSHFWWISSVELNLLYNRRW